jgi:FlaA1/EpsC-like NDP-sugar epimerase
MLTPRRLSDQLVNILLAFSRPTKRAIAIASDGLLIVLTVWFAFVLRLEAFVPVAGPVLLSIAIATAMVIPIFIYFGLYNAVFRHAGSHAMVEVARAVFVYGLGFAVIFTLIGIPGVPRSVGIIQPTLLLMGVISSRAIVRDFLGRRLTPSALRLRLRLLIYGAGQAGQQLANALSASERYDVVGFLDDNSSLHGQRVNGRLVYSPAKLHGIIRSHDITDILLAIPSAGRARRREILRLLEPLTVRVRTLPGLDDLASGRIEVSELKELDVDDLLGRNSVAPDQSLLERDIHNKNVMVTGAGGSIGSELCRQILTARPKRLVLLELSEFALFRIEQELTEKAENGPTEIVAILGSVQDADRVDEIVAAYAPHTIYHAAAYKHVPLVEGNAVEGLKNNVWGTLVCADVARRHEVENFVLVSTDKAVRPTNVMGASKRLAELVLQAMNAELRRPAADDSEHARPGTCFSMVRFGNVLDSSGSVVPRFRKQIQEGGPLTLTHPEVTRFFMTIPEAAQLVIQAGAMGTGGDVFLLDMGKSVRIGDLARRMVALSGLTIKDENNPDGDIEIRVIGLRPGEKLYEELLIGENPEPTDHPRIMRAHEDHVEWGVLDTELKSLKSAMTDRDMVKINELLVRLVSGYKPSRGGDEHVQGLDDCRAAQSGAA